MKITITHFFVLIFLAAIFCGWLRYYAYVPLNYVTDNSGYYSIDRRSIWDATGASAFTICGICVIGLVTHWWATVINSFFRRTK